MKRESASALLQRLYAEGVAPWASRTAAPHPADAPHGAAAPARDGTAGPAPTPDRSEPAIADPPLPFVGALVPPSSPGAARRACDALLSVHRLTDGRHGHVSVPVDPRAAHDARALTAAARALRRAVGRANLLVRVPATPAGLAALSDCLAEGVGVDVSLLFGAERYVRVLDAYFTGMERALAAGLSLHGLGCVTSFPVGPLDAAVRALLGRPPCGDADGEPWCAVALAVARQVFRLREERLASPWWRVLRSAGARPPRLLWTEPECRHIGALVGWNTAVALPAAVLEAAPDDLEPRGDTLLNRHAEGARTLAALERRGIPMAELARVLEARELSRLQHTWPAGPGGPAGRA